LRPLTQSHTKDLFANLSGPSNDHLYKYLSSGPFNDLESFTKQIQWFIDAPDLYATAGEVTAVSIICLLNIVPSNRSIEIGHVMYAPTLQRTTAATAAYYLLMKLCFEDLHYLRVEWKCNDRNKPSERAALRLGFKYEGTFRKHMIIKGRRRDSAWFSVLDEEWNEVVGKSLEAWLGEGNFDEKGGQKRKLEDVREDV
ncbi:acyl-CoA N-acyltransferase, partial [Hyaloscypha variabilis F]